MTSAQAPIWELPEHERPVEGLTADGEPDPAYAAALGLVSASPGRRAGAAAIDIGVFVLLQVPFLVMALPLVQRLLGGRITWYGFVNHPDFLLSVVVSAVTLLLSIIYVVAQLAVQGKWGFTLGKAALGLRVVNVATLEKPGFLRTAGRALVAWVPVVTVVGTPVVLASPLWAKQDRLRGWHDRVGRAWVVDARHGLDPYDKKLMRIARKTVTSDPAVRSRSLPSLATVGGGAATRTYVPGARVSAGVLGVARPHTREGRVVVGLTGFELDEQEPGSDTGPRLGAYVAPALPARPADPVPVRPAPEEHSTGERAEGRHAATGSRLHVAPESAVPPAPAAPVPAAPAAPPAEPDLGTVLLLDTGQRLQLSGAVVVGRSPIAVGDAVPLVVNDPDSSISKTHAVLRPVPGGVQVIDQGSTNGTAVMRDGQDHPLAAGEVGTARTGDLIRIGDRTARVLG